MSSKGNIETRAQIPHTAEGMQWEMRRYQVDQSEFLWCGFTFLERWTSGYGVGFMESTPWILCRKKKNQPLSLILISYSLLFRAFLCCCTIFSPQFPPTIQQVPTSKHEGEDMLPVWHTSFQTASFMPTWNTPWGKRQLLSSACTSSRAPMWHCDWQGWGSVLLPPREQVDGFCFQKELAVLNSWF